MELRTTQLQRIPSLGVWGGKAYLLLILMPDSDWREGQPTAQRSSPTRPTITFKHSLCELSRHSLCSLLTPGRPPDLLEEREEPHALVPYSTIPSSEPVNAVAIYPLFNLQNPSTTLVLSSVRDHPICLSSALVPEKIASYSLVNPNTEAFITPHSLLFTKDGTRFIAGSNSLISIFEVSRPGQSPLLSLPTASKRSNSLANPGIKMKGIISSLAVEDESGLLAAGTFTRHVGLYDSGGTGECVGVFTVEGTEADKQIRGRGLTQVIWSPCGRYLYIVERKSNGVMIYDIRQTGQLVSWLEGRRALTNQRLGVDLIAVDEGHEVWAGGTDGMVRVWKNAHQREGGVEAELEWSAHDG
jgi:telomerase Cajal body protein 1